jgi:hypothetical protein
MTTEASPSEGTQIGAVIEGTNAAGPERGASGLESRSTPRTTAADFRKLTPIVLMRALRRARTVVCEPMSRIRIETPTDPVSAVLASVARSAQVSKRRHGAVTSRRSRSPSRRPGCLAFSAGSPA